MLTRHTSGVFLRAGMDAKIDAGIVWDIIHTDEYYMERLGHRVPRNARVVDVGAQVGCASVKLHSLKTESVHACVEMWAPHFEALRANVQGFGRVFEAAMTYDHSPMVRVAGNSIIGHLADGPHGDVLVRTNPVAWQEQPLGVPIVTLEHVLDAMGWDCCEMLKLDCEGSEHSILRHADLSRVGMVVMEWHGLPEWEETQRYLSGWEIEAKRDLGNRGIVWLVRRS